MSDAATVVPRGHRRLSVEQRGTRVVIEVECPDHYDAIRLAETLGEGIKSGGFTLQFGDGGKP